MRDEDVGEPELAAKRQQQVQHLSLHRLVERGDRLVENEQPRFQRERTGDVHPLALPAGKLVRVAPDELGGVEPHQGEQLPRPLAGLGRRHAVDLRPEHDRVLDGQAWVEGGIRVLEHHLHLAPELAQARRVVRLDGLAVEDDAAGIGADEVHEQARGRRFPAARLADNAQHLARQHVEVDIVHRLHPGHGAVEDAAAHREIFPEVADFEQRGSAAARIVRARVHSRTSMAPLSPSLSRLKDSEVKKIITPGRAATQGLT